MPRLLALNAYWVGLSFMWNALHPIVLPALLLSFVPDSRKNTYLGLLTFVGLMLAIIIQPMSGAISDSWGSRYGRRRPLMLVGTVIACCFLPMLGRSSSLIWLVVGYIGLQLGSNIAQGPLQGLLRDRVAVTQLGLASSVKILLDFVSLILASFVAGRLMDARSGSPTAIMLIILGLLAGSAAITILFTPEDPSLHYVNQRRLSLRERLKIDLGGNASYWWLLGERALFLLGVYGVQAFGQYYLQDVLRVPDPPRQSGDLLAAIGAGIVVLVLVGGWLTDRFGIKRILGIAGGLTAMGLLVMVFMADASSLIIVASILGAGIGLFLTSNWALANRLAPQAESGKFLGLTNLATAGAAALARLQGPVVDVLNSARPGDWIGYRGIFVFGILCILASTFLLTRIEVRA